MMGRSVHDIGHWAEKNGYEFQEQSNGPSSSGAAELDSFRSAEEFTNYVTGSYRNRPFVMLDVKKSTGQTRHGRRTYTNQTLLLLPNEVSELPDFEIVPRGFARGLSFLGHGGVTLNLSPDALRETRDQVTAFNQHYRLYEGGVLEAGAQLLTADDDDDGDSDPSRLNSICTPRVFQFLSQKTDWYIELQGTYLIVWTPSKILSSEQRTEMLQAANELLKLLQQSAHEQPIQGLTLTQTSLTKKRIFGTLIGGAAGFFLGAITTFAMAILVHKFLILALPVFALCGAAIGGFLAGKFIGH